MLREGIRHTRYIVPIGNRVTSRNLLTTWRAESLQPLQNANAFLERHRWLLLAVFTAVYFVGTALRARSSPLWHDELYTMMLSRLDLRHMLAGIRDGIDTSPPFADMLVRAVNLLWGEGNIVSRIPAMIGFWAFCLCLFAFVRRRAEIGYAFSALLLPICTGAYMYAIQARCYGIILGLCGIAVLCWQTAAEGRKRRLVLPVLALSLAAAMYSHYYGFLILVPLGGAELWRDARRRMVDWPIWGALVAGGLIGAVLCFPLLEGTRRFRGHPWAVPELHALLDFYPSEMTAMVTVAVLFLMLLAGWWLIRRTHTLGDADVMHDIPGYEIVMAALFLALPVLGFAAAELVTHMFSARYFIWAITGIVLLSVFMIAVWSRGSRTVGILLLAATALPAAFEMAHHLPNTPVIDSQPLLRQALEQGPVVMDEGIQFFEQWYYLPPDLKSRVSYVADPESDARWTQHDTIDVGMLELRKWFGMPILYYNEVAVPGTSFRIYHEGSGPTWLPNRLLSDGARIEMLATSGDRSILRVTVPAR